MFISSIRSEADDRSPAGRFWFEPIGMRTAAGVRVTPASAMALPAVFACVRVLAESFAIMPFMLYRPNENGGRAKVRNHWLYRLIAKAPNRFQSPYEWRLMMQGHLALRGNAFNQITANSRGEITELLPLHPDRMSVEMLSNGSYRYVYLDQDGRSITYSRHEIWHLRGMSDDGLMGMSPIGLAREAIGEGLAIQSYSSRFFTNDAKPGGGWIEYPGSFATNEAKKKFRESWQELQGGSNRGKVAVLEKGMKFHELGLSNKDSQFIEARGAKVTEIARIFRVPPHKIMDLARCMPGDTLVFTSTGPKPIASVLPGEKVWSPTPTGPKLCTVLNNWYNGVRETLEIRTTNRTVRCTANHRLLVRRAHERDLNPGETGGKNVGGKKKRVVWRNEYVMAGELREGDTLVTLDRLPSQGRTISPTGRVLTEGFMEFAGLLMADGNVKYQNGKPSHVSIARADTASYMPHYRHVMRSEFTRCATGGIYASASPLRAPVHLTEGARCTIFASVEEAGALFKMGFAGTAFTKRIPGWVFETSEDHRLAFLRGFLDGDGTVDAKGRITYYSANKALLDDVRHLCMSAGVPVTNVRSDVNRKPAPGSKHLVPTRMWRFTCSDPGANARIGSHDARYIERLQSGKPFGRKDRAYPRFGGKNFAAPGLALSRIISIEKCPAEAVYDIEVEGEHCFFADGVASHNSTNNNIEHQGIEFWTDTMLPWATLWESSIGFFLLGPDEDLEPDFDHKPMMRGDGQARAERISKLVTAGVMTRNEGREEEGYDPIDGLDEPLRPLNMVSEDVADDTEDQSSSARMRALLHSNASRMARRLAAGKPVSAETLADALAISTPCADSWLSLDRTGLTEDELTASLLELGETA